MITVVIPTLNAEATLGACLRSLRAQETPIDQIIIVDGGSTDTTVQIARATADIVLTSSANRSLQRNAGWQMATSPIVLFVDADMVLDPYVVTACEDVFNRMPSVVGLVIPEQSYGTTFWSRVKAFERTFYQNVWWMEAARCFRRDCLIRVGGYDPALIGGEDWDLDERVRQYSRVERIQPIIWHNEQDLTLERVLLKKGHYASTLSVYAARHPRRAKRQLSLASRLQLFARRPWSLLIHPILAVGLLIMGSNEWWTQKYPNETDEFKAERPIQ